MKKKQRDPLWIGRYGNESLRCTLGWADTEYKRVVVVKYQLEAAIKKSPQPGSRLSQLRRYFRRVMRNELFNLRLRRWRVHTTDPLLRAMRLLCLGERTATMV